jgi:hypothetical protein
MNLPTIVVGRGLADRYMRDSWNPYFMDFAMTAETLEAALGFAHRIAHTDKVLVFDGSLGNMNVSPSLAEFLMQRAPEVAAEVDQEFMPRWLKQRGIDPEDV